MKVYRLLLLLGIILLGSQAGRAQFASWSRPLSPAVSSARSVTDQAGNTYVTGAYSSALTMGATTLPAPTPASTPNPANTTDAYLAKINPQGLVEWALAGTSPRPDHVLALTLDPSGNVHVAFQAGIDSLNTGTGSYSFTFGGLTVTQAGTMLAKVSPAGAVATLHSLHVGTPQPHLTGLDVDAAGNAYVSVAGATTEVFGAYTFPGVGTGRGVSSAILRVQPTGSTTLLHTLVPSSTTGVQYSTVRVEDLKVGPAGDLYLTGDMYGTVTLGTSPAVTLTAVNAGMGAFVARYSAAGVAQWGLVNNTGGLNSGSAYHVSLALAPTGDVYVAGQATSPNIGFGSLPLGTTGGYLLKVSASGAPLWVRAALTSAYNDGTKNAVRVVLDGAGNVYRLGVFDQRSVSFGSVGLNHPLLGGPQQQPAAFYIVSYDAAGTPRWARSVDGENPAAGPNRYNNHQGAGLGIDTGGNLYLLNHLMPFTTANSQLYMNGQVLNPGYTVLRLSPAGAVSGTIYFDLNGNGVRDTGENPFPLPQIVADQAVGQSYASTSSTGEFTFFGAAGTAFDLTIPSPSPYYTLSAPSQRTGTYPAVGQTTGGQNFGLVALNNQADVRVTLTPLGAVRPGFTTQYRVTLENIGTTVLSGTATATLDSRMVYTSSIPAGSLSGQTLTWNYSGLAPFTRLDYDIYVTLPATVALGTVIATAATAPLSGDVNQNNNSSGADQIVVGSYDPNDISVNYSRLTPAQVAAGQPLDYTIRFQNMGTDQAFTVVITDALDARRLNLGGMELISQSHNCQWSLTGQGLLTVRFPNINLPHRAADALRSQGYVRFRVRPRTTLAVGDVVPNEADIFFDYNAPVRTNTATTAVLNPTALLASSKAAAWTAYPNPATDALTISARLSTAGTVGLELTDALGRRIRQHRLSAPAGALHHTLSLQSLAPGFYLLRLTLPDGTTSSQRVQVNP